MSLFNRVNSKIISTCGHPIAPWVLSILSFTESCFFVIPPEVLLLPMCYARRGLAWMYAAITSLTSVMGAIAGYFIGMLLWDEFQLYAFEYIPHFSEYFDEVGVKYQENATVALFLAAFTPIPFKVFTVAAGVYSDKISLALLVSASLVGRSTRYFILAAIVYYFGAKAQKVIEKHGRLLSVLGFVGAALVLAILVTRK